VTLAELAGAAPSGHDVATGAARRVKRTRTKTNSVGRRGKLATLLARDGATCWICRYPLVPDAVPNSPLRTSFDHVVEVAEGGSNRNENLRLAHAVCNNARGRVYQALRATAPTGTLPA
jgi:5-methylcytosine-specific restriction endonuclease McrA